jgi:hypothetical protein
MAFMSGLRHRAWPVLVSPSFDRRVRTSHSLARNEWSPRRIQGFLEEIAELFAGLQQFAHERIRLVIRIERVNGDESMVG